MVVKVVDASALAAIFFSEPGGEMVNARLKHARLAAPALIHFEMANICLKKIRQRPELRDVLLAGFEMSQLVDIENFTVDQRAVLDLAESTGLTAYDASYLWLARRLDAELVSLDKRLLEAVYF
jgi:predicted nucleic acid-binding protein